MMSLSHYDLPSPLRPSARRVRGVLAWKWAGLTFFFIAMFGALLVGAACSSGKATQATAGTPTNGVTQSNEAASVTVAATWRGVQSGSLAFDISMDTHSVNLDAYDLGKLASLRDSAGNQLNPRSWSAPSGGGHHRSGTLAFAVPSSVSDGSATYVELVVRDIGGVPQRVLRWQLSA